MVRPKKFLGQHFLRDRNIAAKIVNALVVEPGATVLEIGPGTGVLTSLLLQRAELHLQVVELDGESVAYLKEHYPALTPNIHHRDFLAMPLKELAPTLHVIGNFPYNISSQIFFKVLDHRNQVVQVVGMVQKEVADRIAGKAGTKTYGILSVLLQAFYKIEVLFKVSPGVFHPPPQVMSAVIRLVRNERQTLPCDEVLFRRVVKQAFQNRRKTLRNALKPLNLPVSVVSLPVMDQRGEQLSVDEFILLTIQIEQAGGAGNTI